MEVDDGKYYTCVIHADAQYFEDKLWGGWEENGHM